MNFVLIYEKFNPKNNQNKKEFTFVLHYLTMQFIKLKNIFMRYLMNIEIYAEKNAFTEPEMMINIA